jgi:hypothetical protein
VQRGRRSRSVDFAAAQFLHCARLLVLVIPAKAEIQFLFVMLFGKRKAVKENAGFQLALE